ncbi:hypothetical protein PYCC9005_005339 [Savitreella phatthalungensis]
MDGDAYVHRLAQWVSAEGRRLSDRSTRNPATLTLHHLYYLLRRFDDLDVPIGPLNVRLEALEADVRDSISTAGSNASTSASGVTVTRQSSSGGNYVSFRDADAASIRSVSSIRSVVSSLGMWSGLFGGGAARTEEQIEHDLKQLYSAFCKIPTVRLQPSKQPARVKGYEDHPFDTSVPLLAFKNLQFLELVDYPITSVFGWDALAEQLTSLVLRRCSIDNLEELTLHVPRREHEIKRRRQERALRRQHPREDTLASGGATSTADRPVNRSPELSAGGRGDAHDDKWRLLRYLSLADNALADVTDAGLAPLVDSLQFLDLSRNPLTSVPVSLAALTHLRSLDLSYCAITTLHALAQHPLPSIATLTLRHNRLASLAGIERLAGLERLDIRDNHLKDPVELARLSPGMPLFKEVYVNGNPFTRAFSDYRTTIFNIFRGNHHLSEDILIDGRAPGMLEKRYLVARAEEPVPVIVTTPRKKRLSVQTAGSRPESLTETIRVANAGAPAARARSPASASGRSSSHTGAAPNGHNTAVAATRKKPGKSRIVDLDGDSATTDSTAAAAVLVDSPSNVSPLRPRRRRDVSQPHAHLHGKSPSEEVKFSSGHGQGEADLSSLPLALPTLSPEDYRAKIERLKKEVGAEWLSVLNTQTS